MNIDLDDKNEECLHCWIIAAIEAWGEVRPEATEELMIASICAVLGDIVTEKVEEGDDRDTLFKEIVRAIAERVEYAQNRESSRHAH